MYQHAWNAVQLAFVTGKYNATLTNQNSSPWSYEHISTNQKDSATEDICECVNPALRYSLPHVLCFVNSFIHHVLVVHTFYASIFHFLPTIIWERSERGVHVSSDFLYFVLLEKTNLLCTNLHAESTVFHFLEGDMFLNKI